MKPKLIRVQCLKDLETLAGADGVKADYMGNRYFHNKKNKVIYWKQLQPAIVGWGFTIKEN